MTAWKCHRGRITRAVLQSPLVFLFALAFTAHAQISVTATRLSDQPLLSPVAGTFYDAGLFNPAAARLPDGRILLLTRAQNKAGLSQIGGALSTDASGTKFVEQATPVLAPAEPYERDASGLHGGVEDPRVVRIGRTWYLTYTGYNGKDAQLCLATSRDLRHWRRRGVILPAYGVGKQRRSWNQQWTKSGAIVPQKINGRWWMYYLGTRTLPDGQTADDRGGTTVDCMGLASSPDLLHWKDATPEPVLRRRVAAFDSRVMEPGPPPILTPAGILLLYNGADAHLVYRTGWALFDAHDPARLLARSDAPFFQPELPWEIHGQVPNVVFLEGMVTDRVQEEAPQFAKEFPKYDSQRQVAYRMLGYYGAGDTNVGGLMLRIVVDKVR
jgi:predicted GH43/DUF377 family glycosyl hydrolase